MMKGLVGLLVFAMTMNVWAQEGRNQLEARIAKVSASPAAKKAAIARGKKRAKICAYCHGEDGHSLREYIPHLAGQNTTYLLDQIERFADGRRRELVMQALSKGFTDQDKVDLAIYYNSIYLVPSGGDPWLARKGKQIYHKICIYCHGDNGRGEQGYARLAGQRPQYIEKTLKDFRDRLGDRNNPTMIAMAIRLSDEDIKSVAAYIGGMR